jgi:hypothetical protein
MPGPPYSFSMLSKLSEPRSISAPAGDKKPPFKEVIEGLAQLLEYDAMQG